MQLNATVSLMPLLEAVKDQFVDLPITKVDLTGRTVIVLGANVSLGLEGESSRSQI